MSNFSETATPLISVIMPNYQAMPHLMAAVASVLAQRHPNLELVICDDGSRDESREYLARIAAEDARVRVILQDNQGVAAARNAAIQRAKGRYLALMDSDDLWYPDKLSHQLAFMQRTQAAICHGWYDIISEQGARSGTVKKRSRSIAYRDLLRGERIDCLSTMVDRTMVEVPLFAAGAQEDFAWSLALMRGGAMSHCLPEVLGAYRIRATSRSSDKWRNARDVWQITAREPVSRAVRIDGFLHYLVRKIVLHSLRRISLKVSTWMTQRH